MYLNGSVDSAIVGVKKKKKKKKKIREGKVQILKEAFYSYFTLW